MAIVLASTPGEANADNQLYDKIKMAKNDASLLLNQTKRDYMEVRIKEINDFYKIYHDISLN